MNFINGAKNSSTSLGMHDGRRRVKCQLREGTGIDFALERHIHKTTGLMV